MRKFLTLIFIITSFFQINSQNKLSLPDGREAFLSGMNVAWQNFGGDVADTPIAR